MYSVIVQTQRAGYDAPQNTKSATRIPLHTRDRRIRRYYRFQIRLARRRPFHWNRRFQRPPAFNNIKTKSQYHK